MDIKTRMTKMRIKLLLDRCFYGNLALHLKLVKVEDNSIPTLATDGKSIMYNPEFVKTLEDWELEYILCHEILHNVFYHLTRRENREVRRWNMAIDYATNGILYKEFGKNPKGALFNHDFENLSAETIYNKLPDLNKKGKNGNSKNGNKNGKGQKGNGNENVCSNETIEIELDSKGNVKKVNGEKVKNYDEHKDIQGNKSDIEELEKDWKIQTTKSYQQSKIQGKAPNGMDIFIKELMQPKLDWRNMMKQFVCSIAKCDYRWLPPNKKFIHRGLYLPSITGESLGDVVVIIDNSGSTMHLQKRFFSECNGLLQQYEVNLHLIVVDMAIQSYEVYHKGDTIKKEYSGGGGTDMRIGFDEIKKKYINPSVVVCLSDGYTPFPKREEYPTLWVISEDGIDLKDIPFGQKVIVNED